MIVHMWAMISRPAQMQALQVSFPVGLRAVDKVLAFSRGGPHQTELQLTQLNFIQNLVKALQAAMAWGAFLACPH